MLELLIVFLGGCVGAFLRYFVYCKSANHYVATILVNIIGCMLLGAILYIETVLIPTRFKKLKLFITTGIIGSFTTFSTFENDIYTLFTGGFAINAFLYLFSSCLFGILGILAGKYIMSLCFKPAEIEEDESDNAE
jgi:fluoride exporter